MAMLLQIPPSSVLYTTNPQIRFFYPSVRTSSKKFRFRAVREKAEEIENNTSPSPLPPSSAEEVTKKYGLEVGLWKILSSKDEEGENKKKKSKTDEAKELLAKYGGAYLATSITLSLISFSLCYVLVTSGVDVQCNIRVWDAGVDRHQGWVSIDTRVLVSSDTNGWCRATPLGPVEWAERFKVFPSSGLMLCLWAVEGTLKRTYLSQKEPPPALIRSATYKRERKRD